jgi:hypothetical protein
MERRFYRGFRDFHTIFEWFFVVILWLLSAFLRFLGARFSGVEKYATF